MGCAPFNESALLALYPNYPAITSNPQFFWEMATSFIYSQNYTCLFGGFKPQQQCQALLLMTAHLIYLTGQTNAGNTPGIVTNATIDKISVTIQPPPEVNQWQYWLNETPFGRQLLALLQVISVGGFYLSSAPPGRAGFRFSGVP